MHNCAPIVASDPAELIESVYLGPALTDDSRERIREACREAGVTARPGTSCHRRCAMRASDAEDSLDAAIVLAHTITPVVRPRT